MNKYRYFKLTYKMNNNYNNNNYLQKEKTRKNKKFSLIDIKNYFFN